MIDIDQHFSVVMSVFSIIVEWKCYKCEIVNFALVLLRVLYCCKQWDSTELFLDSERKKNNFIPSNSQHGFCHEGNNNNNWLSWARYHLPDLLANKINIFSKDSNQISEYTSFVPSTLGIITKFSGIFVLYVDKPLERNKHLNEFSSSRT